VAHVEAGLRSHDKSQPFPEETYRILVSQLAAWHFAPTDGARDNLVREGIEEKRIFVTGNPIVDAVHWARERPGGDRRPLPLSPAALERFVLVTCHRRESFGEGIDAVCRAVREMVLDRPDLHVLWPVHLNPNVQKAVSNTLTGVPRVHCIEPVDYPTMLRLLERCLFVVTDSGGLQEEAPEFGKPVLILRAVTERNELVEAGGAMLVGTDPRRIVAAVGRLLDDPEHCRRMSTVPNPFGDGQAARRIVRTLKRG
jgi:UDP-N-acetylglucosamine 2-epimerase (non-hydrolysing)